jgi:hypothetical protein
MIDGEALEGRRSVAVAGGSASALAAVDAAAEDWGADWQAGVSGGRIELPVSAGLRHGRLHGRIDVSAGPGGETEVVFRPERSDYWVWTPAVVVLVLAVAGAATTVLWPFYPRLLPVAPFGAILALGAWFLVVTRLQNRGAEEFLELVAIHAAGAAGGGEEDGIRPPEDRL